MNKSEFHEMLNDPYNEFMNDCFLHMSFHCKMMAYFVSLKNGGESDVYDDYSDHQLNMHQRAFNNYKCYDV